MMNTCKMIIDKIPIDNVMIIALGSAIMNWLTDSSSGTIIANITGILILLVMLRKVVVSVIQDIRYLRKKGKSSIKTDDDIPDDEHELTNELL